MLTRYCSPMLMLLYRLAVPVLLVGSSVGCYSTQLVPPTTFQITDERGQSPRPLTGRWSAYSLEENPSGPILFDEHGRAEVGPHVFKGNVFGYLGALCFSMLPHQGASREPGADFRIDIPDGYELDAAASGLVPTTWPTSGPGISYESLGASSVAQMGAPDSHFRELAIRAWNTPKVKSLQYRFVFRRQPPAAENTPLTRPSPASPR
jgi:hypothetical protein